MAKDKRRVKIENDRTVLQPVQFFDDGEKSRAILIPEVDNLDEMASYKNLRKKRLKRAISRAVLWSLIVILLPVLVFFTVVIISPTSGHNFFGHTFYLVTSNSMVPVFDPFDMIIVKTEFGVEDIEIGTDVTFLRKSDGEIVTHRVVGFEDTESGRVYTTRGVNNTFDDEPLNFNNIMGIMVHVSVVLGDVVTFLRSTGGMFVLFSFFALLIAGIYVSFFFSNDIRAVGK